jgi:hypothetical protein
MNVRAIFQHLGIIANSLRGLRNQVNNAYVQYPKIVNSCTGFVTFASGDILAQKIGQQQKGLFCFPNLTYEY